MTLKDLLKKKDRLRGNNDAPEAGLRPPESETPEFTFLRTTTNTQEQIEPPSFPDENKLTPDEARHSKFSSRFRKSSNPTAPSTAATNANVRPDIQPNDSKPRDPNNFQPPETKGHERKFSERLHLRSHSRSRSASSVNSVNVPDDLPAIENEAVDVKDEDGQARWEARATILAKSNGLDGRGRADTVDGGRYQISGDVQPGGRSRHSRSRSGSRSIGDEKGDANIQKAIELHEAGDLERSTKIFGILADPKGENNALSQVLYGLALRHGWGCEISPEQAVTYLSLAASNSADIESQALGAGMKKGGAAKGELVLAIFELANCFRHGWGIAKDPEAAKKYYETAANLGDTDAMNEVAWCYLEGFGVKKDKVRTSSYLFASFEPLKRGITIPGNGPSEDQPHEIEIIEVDAMFLIPSAPNSRAGQDQVQP
ncbi:MAG: hypothetical protein M1820_003436 [Bogoriella megaspora]|nr:MAG: hypothetical protein M1820_003436 [Bogoriella megaspora]